jgi:hypothetical protein
LGHSVGILVHRARFLRMLTADWALRKHNLRRVRMKCGA